MSGLHQFPLQKCPLIRGDLGSGSKIHRDQYEQNVSRERFGGRFLLKGGPIGPVPWDILVFVTITTVGFGFSVQRLMNNDEESASSNRGIASLAAESGEATRYQNILDLGCIERKTLREKLQRQEGKVRVKGKFCHLPSTGADDFQGISITNETTGKRGTVFFRGRDGKIFITDDIRLSSGKNVIKVEWRRSGDSPSREYYAEVYGQ